MSEETAERDFSDAGKGGSSFKVGTDGLPSDSQEVASPVIIQKLSPVRQTYSFPGSVAKSDMYSRFRVVTEDMMNEAMAEAKRSYDDRHGIIRKTKTVPGSVGRYIESEMTKAHFEKVIKQIKWFWFEIEDYLREIETTYNEVRLHNENFEARRRDKEEDLKRQRRVSEFNARSCRIVYDLQQQTKDVFGFLDKHDNKLNKLNLKKLHSIHRGVVSSLHNLLSRLPDYDLDRGLPPIYHQLAMLIRRLAQCCYQLEFGQDIHIIRNLENIRQKVETSEKPEVHDLPLYKLAPDAKRPPCPPWKTGVKGKAPLIWQEYDAHNKGRRPPGEVSNQIMDLIDLSTGQGYIAPVQLQSGIERFLRMRSPRRGEKKLAGTAFKIPAIGGKLAAALGGHGNLTEEEFEAISKRWKKLQNEFITEVEGEISARLQPLLREAKKVADAQAKRTYKVAHVQVEPPTEALMRLEEAYWKLQDPILRLQDNQVTQSEEYILKQKAKMNEVLGYLTKFDSEFPVRDRNVMMVSSDKLSGQGDVPYPVTKTIKKKRRTRSPITISKARSDKSRLLLTSPCSDRIIKPKGSVLQRSSHKTSIQMKRTFSIPKESTLKSQGFEFASSVDNLGKTSQKSKTFKITGARSTLSRHRLKKMGDGIGEKLRSKREDSDFDEEDDDKSAKSHEADKKKLGKKDLKKAGTDEEDEEMSGLYDRIFANDPSENERDVLGERDLSDRGDKDKLTPSDFSAEKSDRQDSNAYDSPRFDRDDFRNRHYDREDYKSQKNDLDEFQSKQNEREEYRSKPNEQDEHKGKQHEREDLKKGDVTIKGKGRKKEIGLGAYENQELDDMSLISEDKSHISKTGGRQNLSGRKGKGNGIEGSIAGKVGVGEGETPRTVSGDSSGRKYSPAEKNGMGDVGKKGMLKNTYHKTGPPHKEALIYMMQEDRPPSGGTAGSPNVDEDAKLSPSSPHPSSRRSAATVQEKVDENQLQWALQGSLTLWSQNEVDEMLDKVKDMEEEEQIIRQRWQDMIYLDPSMKGLGSNYQIAYGENPQCGELKDPDAVVLMKANSKQDTVVVITALPEHTESDHQSMGIITPKHCSPLSSPKREAVFRYRAGWDSSSHGIRIHIPKSLLSAINNYCMLYDIYLQKTSHYVAGNFDPWKVIEEVSDDILNDLFLEISDEIYQLPDICAADLYEAEFLQSYRNRYEVA